MNKFPLANRFMPRAAVAGPTEIRMPFRLWMTGSLAVVMAALVPMRDMTDRLGSGSIKLIRHSRFGVAETLERIEAAAHGAGLSVLARVTGERPLIVLASSVGGTLIVMDEPNSRPEVPLGLVLRAHRNGGADVLGMAAVPDQRAWAQLPEAVLRDVTALPTLVANAIG